MGVGGETTFLRGALDKLGVEPQLEQRYEYKNAAVASAARAHPGAQGVRWSG